MFKQIKLYYVIVTLPFVMLLAGSVRFMDAIKSTVTRNPHPQINYTIFYIILFGGALITLSVYKLVHEAKTIVKYSKAVRANTPWATVQNMVDNFTGDIANVLQMLATSGGRTISHQEQAAIEHELVNARTRLLRRNALPQYLTGLLVGMGLLGTFIGLLSTLSDISALIGSFADLDMATANPLTVFRNMIERMKAPMQSMSIAFSASMFGLLGSIILGLMMLGIRRLQGDIFSLLGSEVARHIEIALSYEIATSGASADSSSANSGVTVSGVPYSGEEYKVLVRIEERMAEAARVQQRLLSSELEEFQAQRADMVRILTEQNEANNSFRTELQQLGRQFAAVLSILDKGTGENRAQIADLAVQLSADAKETQKLNIMQIEEQRRLRETLDSCKIDERLSEAARVQERILSSEIADLQNQRSEMLRALDEQNAANNTFRTELQQLGRQLAHVSATMDKGTGEIYSQVTELMVHMAADAKESHKLLTMQINEQTKLRESLDWRTSKE